MGNIQVRLPEDLQEELDQLAKELATTRSQAIRTIMQEGITAVRLEQAVHRYLAGEFSLERAARYARVSLHRFSRIAAERGIPYYRHSVTEAEEDRQTAEEWLKKRR